MRVCPLPVRRIDRGKTRKLKVSRNIICDGCAGKGSEKEGASSTCTACRGAGREMITQRVGPGMIQVRVLRPVCRDALRASCSWFATLACLLVPVQQMMIQCRTCNGAKTMIAEKDRCKKCKGKKVVPESKLLEVNIEKGMLPGQKIRFYGDAGACKRTLLSLTCLLAAVASLPRALGLFVNPRLGVTAIRRSGARRRGRRHQRHPGAQARGGRRGERRPQG